MKHTGVRRFSSISMLHQSLLSAAAGRWLEAIGAKPTRPPASKGRTLRSMGFQGALRVDSGLSGLDSEWESTQLLVSTDWSKALSSSISSRSKIQSPFWILVTWSLCSIQPSSSWDTTKWVELYWLMARRWLGKENLDPMACHGGGAMTDIRYFF